MVVLEKEPNVFLVALFVRGFYLEVRTDGPATNARYLYKGKPVGAPRIGTA